LGSRPNPEAILVHCNSGMGDTTYFNIMALQMRNKWTQVATGSSKVTNFYSMDGEISFQFRF